MSSPKEGSNSPTNPPVVEGFFSPPLPNWKELRDLPEPTGPLPEEEDDAESPRESEEKSKEATSAILKETPASDATPNQKESGKGGKDVKGERT